MTVGVVCEVYVGKDKNRTYALKKMKKRFIVDMKQQQHVMQEKKLLLSVRCPFIVRSVSLILHVLYRPTSSAMQILHTTLSFVNFFCCRRLLFDVLTERIND